jgi:hypothetical protein
MVHRNAIAYANRPYLERRTPASPDASLNSVSNLPQVNVSRDHFTIRIDHSDKRLLYLPLGTSQSA